jgi:hypothetical protein
VQGRAHGRDDQVQLVAHDGVDQSGGALVLEDVVQTGLVAAYACLNLVGAQLGRRLFILTRTGVLDCRVIFLVLSLL